MITLKDAVDGLGAADLRDLAAYALDRAQKLELGATMGAVIARDQRVSPWDALPKSGGATLPPPRFTTEGYDELVAAGAVSLLP